MQRHSLWDNCDPVALAVLALSVGAVLFPLRHSLNENSPVRFDSNQNVEGMRYLADGS